MKKLMENLKTICEVYINESNRGLEKMKGSEYWTGYHKGQKNLAEHILKKLEESK